MFSVGTLFSNLYLMYFASCFRVKKNKMQDGSYLLLNLVVSDVLKSVFSLPMNVISSYHGKWMFDQIGTHFISFLLKSKDVRYCQLKYGGLSYFLRQIQKNGSMWRKCPQNINKSFMI